MNPIHLHHSGGDASTALHGARLSPTAPCTCRVTARGKFLYAGAEKFYARGVTYGPFEPDADGCAYGTPDRVRRDFAAMAANGINAVRTYTAPPRWLADIAHEQGLRVLVGVALAGEQQSAFLESRSTVRAIQRRCVDEVRTFAGHPAVMGYAIGNEIPAPIVRWHGRRRVEQFLRQLAELARDHDPDGLVTYVNYPSTEYLQLPFLDFLSFNVYLESRQCLEMYLARLQSIADYKPLVLAEVGLDSLRHGLAAQASSVRWQLEAGFAGGCAGAFVFAWTDEWHTGGAAVENWRFGLTDLAHEPKPALAAAREAFAQVPLPHRADLPRITVAVCSYNGARTIRDCLEGCTGIDYPDYEVIVVNDGSTDATAQIARDFDVRLISTTNSGLSHARNTALRAASGEIIAYVDDDARPDPHWLRHLAHTFQRTDHAAVGGPNIVPPDDPPLAQCVANSPGGPTHILLSDQRAEHIPGCNMAFRVERLRRIGGFDPQFRIAGDDVDVCWRLQEQGWTIGFNPAAVVWHHRRSSVRAYWKQQLHYGRAEAMLEVKWPEKFNAIGHISWMGRLYGTGFCRGFGLRRPRIYHGVWATGAFQSLCRRDSVMASLPLTPEWYLLLAGLTLTTAGGLLWRPLLLIAPILCFAAAATLLQAMRSSSRAMFNPPPRTLAAHFKLYSTVVALHLIQPAARLWGRLGNGLSPWRRRASATLGPPLPRTQLIWSEQWQAAPHRLLSLESMLRARGLPVYRGGAYDRWDLEVRGGSLGGARTRMAIEEHPGGRQYLRFRSWPHVYSTGLLALLFPAALATVAAWDGAVAAAIALGAVALLAGLRAAGDWSAAAASLDAALDQYREQVLKGLASAADVASSSATAAESAGEQAPAERLPDKLLVADLEEMLEVPTIGDA